MIGLTMFGTPTNSKFISPMQALLLKRGFLVTWRDGMAVTCFTLLSSVLSVAGPLIIVHIVSDINRPAGVLFLFFLLFAIVIAAVRILQDFKTVLMNRIEKGVKYLPNDELLQRVMTADGSLFLKANAGKISALLQNFNQSNKIYIQMFMVAIAGSVTDVAVSMLAGT
jgi:ABC-type multidrug transport system fused ATPase/permease subunit